MNDHTPVAACLPRDQGTHELRFASLLHPGRGVVVPCDGQGHVDLDALPEPLRNAYLVARVMMGRGFTFPTVQQVSRVHKLHPLQELHELH